MLEALQTIRRKLEEKRDELLPLVESSKTEALSAYYRGRIDGLFNAILFVNAELRKFPKLDNG